MSEDLDWLPMEAQTTVTTVSACASRAAFVAGFAYYEAGRFANFGSGSGPSVWYLRFRLVAFMLAVLCLAFSNTINTQFTQFRTGRAKRVFALSSRFWTLTCVRLFLAAYVSDGLAVAFLGDTYFPTSCGSFATTERALAAANVSSVEDPLSPCSTFFATTLTRIAGGLIVGCIVFTIIGTRLQMQPPKLTCCKTSASPPSTAPSSNACARRSPSACWNRCSRAHGAATLKRPLKPPRTADLAKSAMGSGSVETIGGVVVEQCIFISSFANKALTRALPLGLDQSAEGTDLAVGAYMVFSTLALACAVIATIALSNALVFIHAAPPGKARERFAGTATFTVRASVVLYVVALISFILTFATVGWGTTYPATDLTRWVPMGCACISILLLLITMSVIFSILNRTRKFDAVSESEEAKHQSRAELQMVRVDGNAEQSLRKRHQGGKRSGGEGKQKTGTGKQESAGFRFGLSKAFGLKAARTLRSSSHGSSHSQWLGNNPQNIDARNFARLDSRMACVADGASLAVFYTFYNIVTYRGDVADTVANARCGVNATCGTLDLRTPIPVCEGLDYTSPDSPGFDVACNIEAGLDTMGMPFLACNCLAFGLGLVAVLLAKLVPAFGKIYFPKDLVRQGYYALQVETMSIWIVHIFRITLILLCACFSLYGFAKMNPFHYEPVAITAAAVVVGIGLLIYAKHKYRHVRDIFEPISSSIDRNVSTGSIDSPREESGSEAARFSENGEPLHVLPSASGASTRAEVHSTPTSAFSDCTGDKEPGVPPGEGRREQSSPGSDKEPTEANDSPIRLPALEAEASDSSLVGLQGRLARKGNGTPPTKEKHGCCGSRTPRDEALQVAMDSGYDDPAILLVPAARQAADEQSVRRVLTMLSTTPGRSLFIGAFAYDGVAFLFSPGRTVSYPFLILSSLCWSLALLVVIVSTFLSVDVAAFLELPGRAAFARAVLPITKALENMFVGVVLTFLLSFMLIGLIKTGFAVAFEPRYQWVNIAVGCVALLYMIPMYVILAGFANKAIASTKSTAAGLLEWVTARRDDDAAPVPPPLGSNNGVVSCNGEEADSIHDNEGSDRAAIQHAEAEHSEDMLPQAESERRRSSVSSALPQDEPERRRSVLATALQRATETVLAAAVSPSHRLVLESTPATGAPSLLEDPEAVDVALNVRVDSLPHFSSLAEVVLAVMSAAAPPASRAARRWRCAALAVRVHPFFTRRLQEAQQARVKAVLLRHNTYTMQAIFITGSVYIQMMFSDLRDLDATAPLVTTDAVDAINFVFFCCVNVAFAAGVCVVVTSTVFTVQMRRIVTPAAVSKYLQNARPWTRIAADLFALQLYTWLGGVVFMGITKQSNLELFTNNSTISTSWTWLNSMAIGSAAIVLAFLGIHEIHSIARTVRVATDLDGEGDAPTWFRIAE